MPNKTNSELQSRLSLQYHDTRRTKKANSQSQTGGDTQVNQRKNRGVKACRNKLDAALAASNLKKKTQIALAEAIADAEGLDSIPKDLVSKLFRQLPVDPQTIERAAKVLNVSAQSLHLDSPPSPPVPKKELPSPKRRYAIPKYFFAGAVFSLVAWSVYTWSPPSSPAPNKCFNTAGTRLSTEQNEIGIVIAPFEGDQHLEVQMLLAREFTADARLNTSIKVFTHCESMPIPSGDYRKQLLSTHERARKILQRYGAQLLVWGERHGEKVNVRFTHERQATTPINMKITDKTLSTNAADFSFSLDLSSDTSLPADFKLITLMMMQPRSTTREDIQNELISRYQYSGHWLEKAVLSDKLLLRSLSPQDNPRLYVMTASQLCYRYRLLGDLTYSIQTYQQAYDSCSKALAMSRKQNSTLLQASLLGNMATVDIRRHQFESTPEQRISTVRSGLAKLTEAELLYGDQVRPQELATLYQNKSAAWIRLAELEPDQQEKWLEKALQTSLHSLNLSKASENPTAYSMRMQNQCVLKYRLGSVQNNLALLESAEQDCKKAQTYINRQRHPHQWGMIQNNLAVSYAIKAEISAEENAFLDALQAFHLAQLVYTATDYPANWAEVEINKAELNCKLAQKKKDHSLLTQSTQQAESALLVFKQQGLKHYETYARQLLEKCSLVVTSN